MSNGTPEDVKRTPTRWPDGGAARALLQDWLDGPEEAAIYATEVDFRGADLTNMEFYHLFAVACDFSSTVLARIDLAGAYLADTNFTGADLREAALPKAAIPNTLFDAAAMTQTNLRDVSAEHASFVRTDLSGSDIDGYFSGCDFSGADLRNARLSAILSRSTITDIDVTGATGHVYGPLYVATTTGKRALIGREAEDWLSARGATVSVREFHGTSAEESRAGESE